MQEGQAWWGRRLGLLLSGFSLLGLVLGLGLVGPASQTTSGAPPPGQTAQVQLLALATLVSAALVAVPLARSRGLARLLPPVSGAVGIFAGVFLAFIYFVPNHGDAARYGWVAPYTLGGADLMLWGVATIGFSFIAGLVLRHGWPGRVHT